MINDLIFSLKPLFRSLVAISDKKNTSMYVIDYMLIDNEKKM